MAASLIGRAKLCASPYLLKRRGSVLISARATKGSITAIINLNEIISSPRRKWRCNSAHGPSSLGNIDLAEVA